MKIGVATFHCAHNYGAVLQSYGMQRLLEPFGTASLIDYRPSILTNQYDYFHLLPKSLQAAQLKNSALLLRNLRVNRRREQGFSAFAERYFRLSGPAFTRPEDCPEFDFDAVVCGSDQIWNPAVTGGVDPIYFGGIRNEKPFRRVAFAASLGEKQTYEAEFGRQIARMDAIALRESSAAPVVSSFTDKPVTSVLDPTLLIEAQEWKRMAKQPEGKAPYILVYQVDRSPQITRMARELSALTGLGVVELLNYKPLTGVVFRQLAGATPEEFLGYLLNARYVVTNSFHGTAFSILFEKEFYTLPHPTRPQRMQDLLDHLGLSRRLTDKADWVEPVDYARVHPKLEESRAAAGAFLRMALIDGGRQ